MRPWPMLLALSLLVPGVRADEFTVTGRFLYEDKAWGWDGWTGEDPERPIRHADVTVLDMARGRVLGKGYTDDAGEFSIRCKAKGLVQLAARVDAENRRFAQATRPHPRIRVQTPDRTRYSALSPTLPQHDPAQDADLGSTTALKIEVSGHEGNPFNLLDEAQRAFEFLIGPELGVTRRRGGFRMHWPGVTGSFTTRRRVFIGTSDGYDDAVILHEIGHVVHDLYSDSDSPGGVHFMGDSDQDPRLSFSEGWATAFAGAVLAHRGLPAVFVDAAGDSQIGDVHLRLRLEDAAPFFESIVGASDEVAVACVVHDILDGDAGEATDDDPLNASASAGGINARKAWWEVFTGPVRRARQLTMNDAWDGWLKEHGLGPDLDALGAIFEQRAMRFRNDEFEPDNDPGQATLLAPGEGWGSEHTLYYREASSTKSGARDEDWFAVELEAGDHIEIETRYPAGAPDATTQVDPYLVLVSPSGKKIAQDDGSGVGRNARIAFVVGDTGTWRFLVKSKNRTSRYGRYDVRVRRLD